MSVGKAALALGMLVVLSGPVAAQEFYAGKAINVYIGFGSGGGYDLYSRLAARHLGNHIPGNPRLVPQNMPGAGGLKVVNFMFNIPPKDGTALAMPSDGLVLEQVLEGAAAGLEYDAAKLNWVGRIASSTTIYVTWHTSPTKTFEDARRRETALGSSGAGITVYMPKALNRLAGTQFKLITGYQGSNEVLLAMERGEVEGAYSLYSDFKARKGDWLKDGKVNVLFFIGGERIADYPDVPLASDTGRTQDDRDILRLLSAGDIGRALFTTPGVPTDRVAVLRRAFAAMLADPAFKADADKAKLDLDPMAGEDLQKVVVEMVQFPKHLIEKARAARE
ncbi:MAG: Bug family tripartite tricarboxylate transporter substrate binding protein [Gemmatimonas sp.]